MTTTASLTETNITPTVVETSITAALTSVPITATATTTGASVAVGSTALSAALNNPTSVTVAVTTEVISVAITGEVDIIAPTVVITSTASTITALAAIPITITFSEAVTGFVVGNITISAGGSLASFTAVSGSIYTVDWTLASGVNTMDIAAGVVTDAAGNENTAASQFSILSLLNAVLFEDNTDVSVKFQDVIRSTVVTADGQNVYGITDKSPAGNHATGVTGGIHKVNIQNGLPATLYNGTSNYLSTATNILTGDWTEIIAVKLVAGSSLIFQGFPGSSRREVLAAISAGEWNAVVFYDGVVDHTNVATPTAAHIWSMTWNNTTRVARVKVDGQSAWTSADITASTYLTGLQFLYARREAGPFANCYALMRIVFPSILSDANISAFRDYMADRLGVFF